MSKHPEHEDKDAARNSKKPADGKTDDDNTAPSKMELIRIKLKVITHYAMLGFAPAVSAIALILAVIAIVGNKSVQTELTQGAPKFESISTSLSASKGELEKIRAAMEEQNKLQTEELKKLDEQMEKIIQNVSLLQVKMKISPTLEEQLRQPASAPAAASIAPASAVAAVPPAHPPVTAAPAIIPKPVEKKLSPQGRSIKEAIEKFNKE